MTEDEDFTTSGSEGDTEVEGEDGLEDDVSDGESGDDFSKAASAFQAEDDEVCL